jgi:hypothetical protein
MSRLFEVNASNRNGHRAHLAGAVILNLQQYSPPSGSSSLPHLSQIRLFLFLFTCFFATSGFWRLLICIAHKKIRQYFSYS